MKKVWLAVMVVLVGTSLTNAQRTSRDNYVGVWDDPYSWVLGSVPPANIDAAHLNLTIYGYIHREGALTLKKNNASREVIINDTLVIRGNLTIEQNAPELIIGPNAILIVIGNVSSLNNIIIDNGGIFIVSGNMNFHNGNGDNYNNTGGELFVGGSVSENPDAAGHDDWDALDDKYPNLYDFVMCGGFQSCILPVKLSDFQVKLDGQHVALSWSTIAEENFQKFIVQRSADGVTFEEIGELPGAGFNIDNILTKYSFTDETPLLGNNYYRLEAVDLNEDAEFFEVKMVRVQIAKAIAVYPNPLRGEALSLQLNFNPDESDRILLIDHMGNELLNIPASSMEKTIVFKEQLKPGVYMLKYRAKDSEQVEKILVRN